MIRRSLFVVILNAGYCLVGISNVTGRQSVTLINTCSFDNIFNMYLVI